MPIWRREHELARVFVHFIGMIITAIAITAILGRMSHHAVLTGWGDPVPMSVPTAFCLMLSGVGFFLVSRGEATHAGEVR